MSTPAAAYQFDTAKIQDAYEREDRRIAEIERAFAGDEEFILRAIVRGWSLEQARQQRETTESAK